MKKFAVLILFVSLLGCTQHTLEAPVIPEPPQPVLQDGSVLFWVNGLFKRPIYRDTGSELTHVAVIFYVDGVPYLYEASPPNVSRVPLAAYLKKLEVRQQKRAFQKRGFTWFVMHPRTLYSVDEVEAMKQHADSQLGRRYMIRGWYLGRESRGIFCSHLVANILEQSGRIVSDGYQESPGSLYKKLALLYQEDQ